MKTISTILIVFLFIVSANAQTTFQRKLKGFASTTITDGKQTIDGGYILCGYTSPADFSSVESSYLVKLNDEGDTVWTRMFGGFDEDMRANNVVQTYDSGYIITGSAYFPDPPGIKYVIKTDAYGDTLWTKMLNGTTGDLSNPDFIQQTLDSGYIIAGNVSGSLGSSYLLKLTANGIPVWNKTINWTGDLVTVSVKQTADSGFILCGYARDTTSGPGAILSYHTFLLKTNAEGDTLWSKLYNTTGNNQGAAVQQTADGGYVIAGETDDTTGNAQEAFVIKTDLNGDTLWTRVYGGDSLSTFSHAIEQTKDSGYIITGSYYNLNTQNYQNMLLIKTNVNGDTLWTRNIGATIESGNGVQQTTDGGYIVAGTENLLTFPYSGNGYIVKTDANGHSGCNEDSTNLVVSSFPFQTGGTNMIIASSFITAYPDMLLESSYGGNDTALCLTLGINELSSRNNILILYPNPATYALRINNEGLKMQHAAYIIMNVLGQAVVQSSSFNLRSSIDVSFLSAGIYFLKLNNEKEVWTGKFIKE